MVTINSMSTPAIHGAEGIHGSGSNADWHLTELLKVLQQFLKVSLQFQNTISPLAVLASFNIFKHLSQTLTYVHVELLSMAEEIYLNGKY